MKKLLFPLLVVLASCAAQPAPAPQTDDFEAIRRVQLMADLDDPKYAAIQLSEADARPAVCASEKKLACLRVSAEVCRKIHRKELSKCAEKAGFELTESLDTAEPFKQGYVRGCASMGVVKYGADGLVASLDCIKSN